MLGEREVLGGETHRFRVEGVSPPKETSSGYTAEQMGLVREVCTREGGVSSTLLLRKMLQYVIFFDMKANIFCSRVVSLIFVCVCFGAVLPVAAKDSVTGSLSYPESYFSFRDAMLNGRGKTASEFESQYAAVVAEVEATKSGWERDVLLAHCDYVLGRAYRYLGDKKKSVTYFDKAIELCKEVLKNHEVAEAYVVYADAISQNCSVKPKTYAMSHGAKVKTLAKKALALDPTYGAAKYLENSQNIFPPAPFNNLKEGMKNLDVLLDTNQFRMDEYDVYSALSARAYGYLQQGKKEDALHWYQKALELYPDNVAVLEIIPTIK